MSYTKLMNIKLSLPEIFYVIAMDEIIHCRFSVNCCIHV